MSAATCVKIILDCGYTTVQPALSCATAAAISRGMDGTLNEEVLPYVEERFEKARKNLEAAQRAIETGQVPGPAADVVGEVA